MKKPLVLIVSAAAGALVLAGVGAASAHSGLSLSRTGSHAAALDATSEPSESPEPTETPEAAQTPEPSESPEPTPTPEVSAPEPKDTEEDKDDQGDDANDD